MKIFSNLKNPLGTVIQLTSVHTESISRGTLISTMKQAPTSFVGTVVTDEPQIPNWLSVPEPTSSTPSVPSKAARELLHLQYENMFENFIEQVYRGRSLKSLVDDDPRLVSYEDFLRWIKRDPQRNERFKEAQEMRTEFIAGEIIEIADGVESMDPSSPDTVNRDKLRIDTRKWLMSAHNRKRYGETKQVEFGGTISITEALAQAQARVIEAEVVDVTPRLENSDD